MDLASASGSSKDLLKGYHQLAADTLLGSGAKIDAAVLEAAEDGHFERLKSLLAQSPASVNVHCPSSGDTPLMVACREEHVDVIQLLLRYEADVTLQNDADETALDIASPKIRKVLLESIYHEDRAMTNAQALLQSAWLGDAVSVKRSLDSGKNYLDVNCRNSDGLTPLLLVTRDTCLFDKVQSAMENDYDPITVMQELIDSQADVDACDQRGRNALHLMATSNGVHAKKMVSLLMRNNASIDKLDDDGFSPLHIASSEGHTAIIVALVEEGGADINLQGGEKHDTPLMLSAREGHGEAAKYLISQGADITAVDDNGDTALTVAKSPSMVKLLKEAWVDRARSSHALSRSSSPSPNPSPISSPLPSPRLVRRRPSGARRASAAAATKKTTRLMPPSQPSITLTEPDVASVPVKEAPRRGQVTSPTTPQLEEEDKFFLTEGKLKGRTSMGRSSGEESDYTEERRSTRRHGHPPAPPSHGHAPSEPEADEDFEPLKQQQQRRGSKRSDLPPLPINRTPAASEMEADDEQEGEGQSRRVKPATRRAHLREKLNKKNAERDAKRMRALMTPMTPQTPSEVISQVPQVPQTPMTPQMPMTPATPMTLQTPLTPADAPKSLSQLLPLEKEVLAYSSAEEGAAAKETKLIRGRSNEDDKAAIRQRRLAGTRPSKLALQRRSDPTLSQSFENLATIDASPLTPSGSMPSSPMPGASPRTEKRLLPSVGKSPVVSPLSLTSQHHKSGSTPSSGPRPSERLPSLSNMQPLVMVTVDTDRERLKVQQFGGRKAGKGQGKQGAAVGTGRGEGTSVTRSRSLMAVKKEIYHGKKRNSTGSVAFSRENKVPLLPKVFTPQFGIGAHGGGVATIQEGVTWNAKGGRTRHHGPPLKTSIKSPTSPMAPKPPPKLSVVSEGVEVSSGLPTPTQPAAPPPEMTASNTSMSSKGSTLKNGEFEPDSLEQEVILFSTNPSDPTTPIPPKGNLMLNGLPTKYGGGQMFPPPQRHSNLVVNYADPHGSASLSPIWNHYLKTDTDASSSSEYITSYIGQLTPLPNILSPDYSNKVVGTPPQQKGRRQQQPEKRVERSQASDSDHSREPSSGESGGEGGSDVKDGCLKWKRGRLLGKGAYGKVWEGLLSSARMIAVKEVELDTDSHDRAQTQYGKIQAEVAILRSMKHKNIVSYLGTSMDRATVYIFMQYISGGSLQSILKRFGPLDSRTVAHYARQITSALVYLHGNNIIHRDIKGANIMVNSRGVVKLIDFGCAKNCQDLASNMHSVRGTPYWMAPEVICGHGYGRKSDIWSLGCTVLEMATTKPPWADYPPEAAMFQIGMGKPIPPLPDHLDKPLTDFFYLCMTREQNDRPAARDLLQHHFLET